MGRRLPLLLALAACAPPRDEAPADDTGTGTGGPLPEAPGFLQPADGVLSLPATRHDDVFLTVRNVVLGRTQLEIDGISRGTLLGGSDLGRLEAQMLTLYVHGGMIPGLSTMALWTPAAEELRSRDIEIRIAAPDGPPAWSVAPAQVPPLDAVDVRVHGTGDGAVYTVRTPGGAVRWLRPGSTDPADAPASAPMPAGASTDLATLAVVARPGDPQARTLFVLEGAPGPERRLSAQCVRFEDDAWTTAAAHPILSAADDTQGVEWADLVAVTAARDAVLVERFAPHDVETPAPGDRSLLWVLDPCTTTGGSFPVAIGSGDDVAGVRTAVDLAALRFATGPRTFVVDAGGPALIQLDPDTVTVRLVHRAANAAVAAGTPAAFAGTLGAVTLVGLQPGGAVVETRRIGEASPAYVDADPLPAEPTGEAAPFVLDGWPAVAVPLGPGVPVRILASSGAGFVTPTVSGELPACEAVASAPTYDGNLEGRVLLACLADGTLSWFEVAAAAP